MSISSHFGEAQQWAQTHFGNVGLGDIRRSRRVVQLAAGWAREPGASIPRLSQGQAYASKDAYQLLGHAQTTRMRCKRLTGSWWLSSCRPPAPIYWSRTPRS